MLGRLGPPALALSAVSGGAAAAAPPVSACWAGEFSFVRCCLAEGAHDECWSGEFTRQRCCHSHPVLSQEVVDAVVGEKDHWSCGCGTEDLWKKDSDRWDWCSVRRSAMLSWDIGPLYGRFVYLDEASLAACPLGALLFMVAASVSKANSGAPPLELPSLLWADELISLLVARSGREWLGRWTGSGWNGFLMLSHLRQRTLAVTAPGAGAECGGAAGQAFLSAAGEAVAGGAAVPLPVSSALLAVLDGGPCERSACCVPRALAFMALADAVGVDGRMGDRAAFLGMAAETLSSALPSGALVTLLRSPWPVLDAVDRLFQLPQVELTVSDAVRRALHREPAGFFAERASLDRFRMHIFSRREIVSDMVRFARLPFCGMRPFMSLVDLVATAAGVEGCQDRDADGRCSFSFIEGGPHIGDCTLWATAALEAAGLYPFAVGYEPLPDASALFRQSVHTNGWEGKVVVVPRALAARDDEKVTMAYFPGHNGEGTTVRASSEAHCGQHCAGFEQIPTVTLDSSWPALRPARMDVLKLSVNGEELNSLRGARALLSKRQVCSSLVHVLKAQRGWADAAPPTPAPGQAPQEHAFATELWELLSGVGGMEVSLHLGIDHTSQVGGWDTRPRPSTTRLRSAAELDRVFSSQASAHDFLIARQVGLPNDSPCARSLALRHWDEVF